MKNIVCISIVTSLLVLPACNRYSSEKDLEVISIHMDKQEVVDKMSSRGVARGSIINKHGQVIEVREYAVQKDRTGKDVAVGAACTLMTLGLAAPLLFAGGEIDKYWLYFCEGKLVQWGKAGDWLEAQRMVYDINFNVPSQSASLISDNN